MRGGSAPTTGRETETREDRIIGEFCQAIENFEGIKVEVVGHPDREDPGAGGCDALISKQGTTYALEHTTFDAFPAQRTDNPRFRTVISPLEESIPQAVPDSFVQITVPSDAVPTGLPWRKLRDVLNERCIEALHKMDATPPSENRFRRFEFPGVPFPVYISRQYWPEDPGCLVGRLAPADQAEALRQCLLGAVSAKREQLRGYHTEGYPTILILDSDERALINDIVVADAFATATADEELSEIDDVYFAESKRQPAWFYPLKLGQRVYPELPEFEEYRSVQFRQRYPDVRL